MADDNVKTERGTQHPGDNLEAAIQLLEKYKAAIGLGVASRETVAEALGYSGITGTSSRRMGSLTHYGLLERSAGGYKVSELGKKLLMPKNDAERVAAIVEAARHPKLYAALFDKYSDHALPNLLPNILVREFGVAANAADAATKTFRETAEFAGLLRNGVLTNLVHQQPAPIHQSDGIDGAPVSEQPRPSGVRAPPLEGVQEYTVPLDETGRVGMIRLPLPVTAKDVRRVRAWSDYMSSVLTDQDGV